MQEELTLGHSCRICGRIGANEKFSGKGHKNHICKDCTQKPKDEIEKRDNEDEILHFMEQSNISKKNIQRLRVLKASSHQEISEFASLVLEVALIKPHKKKRFKFLKRENKELLLKLDNAGLLF